MRIPCISLLAAGALSLGGCAGYYGYGGDYYGGYGYGYPYFGWYDNFYYPGAGVYVYDSYRRPHVMTTTQRTYWTRRSPALRTGSTTRVRENWSGFGRRGRYGGGRG
jgi:hypothetical protein